MDDFMTDLGKLVVGVVLSTSVLMTWTLYVKWWWRKING